MKHLRLLFVFLSVAVSASVFAQDFYFENEFSFRLNRKCAEKGVIPAALFQETEDSLRSAGFLKDISGDDYHDLSQQCILSDFTFRDLKLKASTLEQHLNYYQFFNSTWNEMWGEDSLYAKKSTFYTLRNAIDSLARDNSSTMSPAFQGISLMPELIYYVPFYRNIIVNWAIAAYYEVETGLSASLPPVPQLTYENSRNVLSIYINSQNEITVNTKAATLDDVKALCLRHIENRGLDSAYSIDSKSAIISLKNERGTSYQAYVELYNNVVLAYNAARSNLALSLHGKPFLDLDEVNQAEIRKQIPQRIAEAEPIKVDK